MKLRKGSKVEVFSGREVPSGSWWCAVIISGNGRTYHVKYDRYTFDTDSAVERVPRKVIRPCPPPVEGQVNWLPGDMVDVFTDSTWVLSEVTKAISSDLFLVRLVGSSKMLRVHSSDIRPRLSWQDNKWVIVGENHGNCYHGRINRIMESGMPCYQVPAQRMAMEHNAGDNHPLEIYSSEDEASRISMTNFKKRPRLLFLNVDAYGGADRKTRGIEMMGRRQTQVSGHSPKEKVDADVSSRSFFCGKHLHASLNRTIFNHELEIERVNGNTAEECHFTRHINNNNAQISSSSVGSCSIDDSSHVTAYPIISLAQSENSYPDEAESYYSAEREESNPTKVVAKEIHRLELLAYRSTMEALYASGPLSWEQESLMANLRLMLHISNDEHLTELRQNLVSFVLASTGHAEGGTVAHFSLQTMAN